MPYLTVPEALTTKQRTYRYFVELASNELDSRWCTRALYDSGCRGA